MINGTPDAASLMDVVRAFKAARKVEFNSVTYQPNGDVTLNYDDKTEQTGSSGRLPEQMSLGIPVYMGGTLYAVPVWIRYRVEGGAVAFRLKLDRADLIEETAFLELISKISDETGIDVYLGRTG